MSQTKEINWDGIPLLTEDALQEKLDDEKWSSVSAFLKKHSAATQERYSILSTDFNLDAQSRGVLSVASFCYVFPCELRGPAWAVGSYSISQSAGGSSQNLATDRTPRSVYRSKFRRL